MKIGTDQWTLTARGGQHSWVDLLEKASTGHVLKVVASENDVRVVLGDMIFGVIATTERVGSGRPQAVNHWRMVRSIRRPGSGP